MAIKMAYDIFKSKTRFPQVKQVKEITTKAAYRNVGEGKPGSTRITTVIVTITGISRWHKEFCVGWLLAKFILQEQRWNSSGTHRNETGTKLEHKNAGCALLKV